MSIKPSKNADWDRDGSVTFDSVMEAKEKLETYASIRVDAFICRLDFWQEVEKTLETAGIKARHRGAIEIPITQTHAIPVYCTSSDAEAIALALDLAGRGQKVKILTDDRQSRREPISRS